MAKISLIVNGNPVNANVDPRTLLVQFLRENLRLTGTHVGCDTSQCGACVVHLDGKAVKACTTLAVMADGQTLVPVMKQRLASPPHLVDLSHIEGLDAIEMKGRSLVIGATAKHADVAASATVREAIPALAELAGMIGDPAVRHKGTIGG